MNKRGSESHKNLIKKSKNRKKLKTANNGQKRVFGCFSDFEKLEGYMGDQSEPWKPKDPSWTFQ